MATKLPRGVGIDGSIGPQAVAELAALAESRGYGSFWINVGGRDVDSIESLRLVLERTKTIEIAAGVFPLDAWPAAGIASRLQAQTMNTPRLIVGVGAGQIREGVVALTESAIRVLRAAAPRTRICTAGYGPRIQDTGGRLADVVLANWMTPERLDWMIALVKAGADSARRAMPPIYLYHRAATGADAAARIGAEMAAYSRYPVHAKHQAAMGDPDLIGVAAATPREIDAQLSPYGDRCRVVLKPLPRDIRDVAEWRSLIEFFRPGA
jgi:alkanesulfonate monooxygenase SsuD/methylene tetrahydromethanopterin reductase-like flavin-dependent oxidoreductase (luciferase family)